MTDDNVDLALKAIDPTPDYRSFAKSILDGWPDPYSVDGADLQEIAFKHGVLTKESRKVPCGENCGCSEYVDEGDVVDCYRLNADLTP
jgi:hypothetical protein